MSDLYVNRTLEAAAASMEWGELAEVVCTRPYAEGRGEPRPDQQAAAARASLPLRDRALIVARAQSDAGSASDARGAARVRRGREEGARRGAVRGRLLGGGARAVPRRLSHLESLATAPDDEPDLATQAEALRLACTLKDVRLSPACLRLPAAPPRLPPAAAPHPPRQLLAHY